MDSEPPLVEKHSSGFESLRLKTEGDQQLPDHEDPYSLNGPSIALVGLAIAFLLIGIPLIVVFLDRPSSQESFLPINIDPNGF